MNSAIIEIHTRIPFLEFRYYPESWNVELKSKKKTQQIIDSFSVVSKQNVVTHFVYLEPDLRHPIVLNFNSAGKAILML